MRVRLRNPDRVETIPGPLTAAELLDRLDLNPATVLVIVDGELVTAAATIPDEAEVEIRPVISGGAGVPRCATCRAPAVIEEPRHRSAWCGPHFVDFFQRQVRKAIDLGDPTGQERGRMFSYRDRVLVAVSGGKDSLALWHTLLALGYRADGVYIGLGIGGYSARSEVVCREFARRYAEPAGAQLIVVDMETEYGYTTPTGARAARRPTCAVCGLSKRYILNRVAVERGYDVLATGHNLDDEAATLLNNLLHWQDDLLIRQSPVLPASDHQVRKVKPLYRLSERETAAYCVLQGIDYVVEECPLVAGNTGLEHKDVLNRLERDAPGTKAQFLFGFYQRARRLARQRADRTPEVGACRSCGMPSTAEVCAFCRQQQHILARLGRDRGQLPLAHPTPTEEREAATQELARRLAS